MRAIFLLLLLGLPILQPARAGGDQLQLIRMKLQERLQKKMGDMDTNGDGSISKAEYMTYAEKQFRQLDRNHDGSLSTDEQSRLLGPLK